MPAGAGMTGWLRARDPAEPKVFCGAFFLKSDRLLKLAGGM